MKKVSIQRFSMLGLILMGVSAATAAVFPSGKTSDASKIAQPGSLTWSSDNVNSFTCTPTANIESGNTCNITADPDHTSDLNAPLIFND